MNLEQLIATCQQERQTYYQTSNPSSPACVEIFRRAFSGNEDAWAFLHQFYSPKIRKWISVQSFIDPEEIMQEVWFAFARYAPQATTLTSTEYIGPILSYLRRCTKSAIIDKVRRHKSRPLLIDQDLGDFFNQIVAADDPSEEATVAMVLRARFNELIQDEKEKLVFQLRFVCNIPPREIFGQYREEFEDQKEVGRIIQRLSRRLRKDEILQELFDSCQKTPSSTSIENRESYSDNISLDSEKEAEMYQPEQTLQDHQGDLPPCPYDEEVLLDYITGLAPAQLCAEIERVPACQTAIKMLREEIGAWMPYLHRFTCPDGEQLIACQEKELTGTERLVIQNHLKICPLCQEEFEMLQAIDEIPLFEEQGLMRRVIEAIFQSPLALPSGQAARGGALQYHTPDIMVNINSRQNRGQPRSWTLRGQLRDQEGVAFTEIEQVELQGGEVAELQGDQAAEELSFVAEVGSNGTFTFKELPLGQYRLRIITPALEIIIRQLEIGD